jgi:hypothetical protein
MPLAIPVVRPRLFLDRSGSVSSTNDVDADGAALLLAGERRPLMAGQRRAAVASRRPQAREPAWLPSTPSTVHGPAPAVFDNLALLFSCQATNVRPLYR